MDVLPENRYLFLFIYLAFLNEKKNYQPLTQPMIENSTRKGTQLIKSLLQEGHIDDMTAKWLSLTPNPPRIPIFYTLRKIYKPTPVGRPIISGCDGPTERISAFVDRLIQPIAQKQDSYLKDTTDFLNFIESTKLPKNTVLVLMDVASLYTNIPHEEGVTTVYCAYEDFYGDKAPIPTKYLREMLYLILTEDSFQYADSGKKPEVAWKRSLRPRRPSRHLAVKTNSCRKNFKMEQVNIEVVKLTPEERTGV